LVAAAKRKIDLEIQSAGAVESPADVVQETQVVVVALVQSPAGTADLAEDFVVETVGFAETGG
jgi:hypothetical protein